MYGGMIQGIKGYIKSTLPPNIVILHLNDGIEEKFDNSWKD